MSQDSAPIAALEAEVKHLQADMTEVKALLFSMKSQQDKWKGGLATIVIIAGAFGAGVAELLRSLGK